MKQIILVDSCCNLPSTFYHENKDILHMISMPVHLGGQDFLDDHGVSVTYQQFYDELRTGTVPKTSQISPIDFYNKFEELYKLDAEIIYIAFSSGMSGTYNNSLLAKDMFLDDYPDAKITIVDSYCASTGYGVIAMKAVALLKDNKFDSIVTFIEDNRLNVNHIFTVNDLMFLKNGGRIPPALAAVGTMLNLKPMMDMDSEGKLRQKEKVRGRKKAYRFFIETLKEKYDPELSPIIIGHGNCEEDAYAFKDMISNELGFEDIIITEESPTIGSHVGPGLMVLGFIGKMRD